MGFLTRAANEEELDQSSGNEELYERLFAKIGRDFVYKADLIRMMQSMMALIDPLNINPVDFTSDVEARRRALEYKNLLDSGRDGSAIYRDLIDLDDGE